MIVVEVLGALVVGVMAAVVTWMAIVGLAGAAGGLSLKRCRSCGHLRSSWSAASPSSCSYCGHPWLVRHVLPVRLHHFFPAEMQPAARPANSGQDR